MGPWIQKKNTPHTTFGGLWGQNSLSFQTNASWAAHQNHFNKLRNVSWGMEMSRNSFSKMGFCWGWLHLKVDAKIKLVATKIKKSFRWIFVLIVSKPVFCWGNLQEILGDGIPPPDFWFFTKLRSINRINRHCWAVRGQNHGAHQASKGWGAYSPEAKAIRMARDDDFFHWHGGSGGYPPQIDFGRAKDDILYCPEVSGPSKNWEKSILWR